jgi:hypothetical protein
VRLPGTATDCVEINDRLRNSVVTNDFKTGFIFDVWCVARDINKTFYPGCFSRIFQHT